MDDAVTLKYKDLWICLALFNCEYWVISTFKTLLTRCVFLCPWVGESFQSWPWFTQLVNLSAMTNSHCSYIYCSKSLESVSSVSLFQAHWTHRPELANTSNFFHLLKNDKLWLQSIYWYFYFVLEHPRNNLILDIPYVIVDIISPIPSENSAFGCTTCIVHDLIVPLFVFLSWSCLCPLSIHLCVSRLHPFLFSLVPNWHVYLYPSVCVSWWSLVQCLHALLSLHSCVLWFLFFGSTLFFSFWDTPACVPSIAPGLDYMIAGFVGMLDL